ncbi:MAG: DUF4249 domain-containing protein [Bacteroidales bacterium]|nr:DUF4249 domain-containing protein [Bacteroidales bacterium]
MKSRNIIILISITILSVLTSCEEVIDIDLNYANPAFVVEAVIYKDSVCNVRLTRTTSFFTQEEPDVIDNAFITISDGTSSEELHYSGNGYYTGNNILGTEDSNYEIEIIHDGITHTGEAYMPEKTDIISVSYDKFETQSTLNPLGETVFTINCEFNDNPDTDNFYMIKYLENGEMIESNYFMLTEYDAIGGTFSIEDNIISFSESIFYEGGEVEVQVFSIDEPVYQYFMQLNDILFWKRRIMPPTPYNPSSNISNGALGYFAAWAYDSAVLVLE